jgi:putative aldouronate transport system substrate-binding protein
MVLLFVLPGILATATGTQEIEAAEQAPISLTYFSADLGRIDREDNPVVAEIEARTNTRLDLNLIPSGDFNTNFNVLLAAGDVPDITRMSRFDYLKYVDQDIFYDISELLSEGQTPNLMKNISENDWKRVTYKGSIYGVPSIVWAGGRVYVMRKDWLNALNLDAPNNLDELKEVLKQFTFGDPDGNGKNDTYGFVSDNRVNNNFASPFSMIFGAFGMQPRLFFERDGKAYAASISTEYRQALEYIHSLYDLGYIDPDIFVMNRDQTREKLVAGVSGSICSWWSIPEQILMDQLKMRDVDPDAEWLITDPITGPNGASGMLGRSPIGGTANISADTKAPLRALQLLDFLNSDEGSRLAFLGIEGEHYTTDSAGGFVTRTDAGNTAMDEKWLDVLAQCVQRTDIQMNVYRLNNPAYWPFITSGRDAPLYIDLFEGITTPEAQQMGGELNKYQLQSFKNFVTGETQMSEWDDYVEGWNRIGGRQIFEAGLAVYNERSQRNLATGN